MRSVLKSSGLCLALLIVGIQSVSGQGKISLSASVDKAVITIGDLITYTVTVNRAEDVEVTLPTLGQNLGDFEIRDYEVLPSVKKDGRIIDKVDYVISTFEVGEFQIPPVDIAYAVPPDTAKKILTTESIKIEVESVKPSEEGEIQDIKPPWEIPYNLKPIIIAVSLGILILLLIAGLVLYFRKRKKGESILPRKIEPPRPPHEVAYAELESLGASDLLENGEIKQYYSEISDIVRRYVEGRYEIIALELTTRQLLDSLEALNIDDEVIFIFREFLQQCDLVKFAKMIPSAEANEQVMKWAVRIIDETRWQEPEDEKDTTDTDQEPVMEGEPEAGIVTTPETDVNPDRGRAGQSGKEGRGSDAL